MESEKYKNKTSIFRGTAVLFCALLVFLASANAVSAEESTFLVDKGYDFYGRSETQAFLAYESDNAYFYFDKEYYDDMGSQEQAMAFSEMGKLVEEFDAVIYPKTKEIFGDEWNPGIDGDEKMTILFVRMNYGIGGYFNPMDEYLKSDVEDRKSNEREMVYLNIDYLDKRKTEGFLSHELQHMIYWNEKNRIKGVNDDIWINEARSELASSIIENALGKSFSDSSLIVRKRDFLSGYADSIADWNNLSADYASVSIFMQYLKDQLGTGFIRPMSSNRRIGVQNLSLVLEQTKGVQLADIFTNWTIANHINDASFDARYGYRNANLKTGLNVKAELIYDKDKNGEIDLMGKIKDWSAEYYEVDLTDKGSDDLYLEINFDGEDAGEFSVPIVINYKDGSREIDFIDLDGSQAGSKELLSKSRNISSIVLIPSCQDMDELLDDNQVKNRDFSVNIKIDPISSKMLADGSLIRSVNSEKIYLIENGQKRWITDSATFVSRGYDWNKVIVISEMESYIYESGENIKTESGSIQERSLVKGSGAEVYLIENGRRRWIRDEKTFNHFNFDWGSILQVSDQELFKFAEGETLAMEVFANGTLIKGAGPKIYLLENDKKRWIVSPEAFSRNKFSWSSVVETSEQVVASYPDGSNVD